MEENEVQALENEQEVISQEDSEEFEVANEDSYVPPNKAEYTKIKRKAIAYDAIKGAKEFEAKTKTIQTPSDINDKLARLELKTEGYNDEEINTIFEFGVDKLHNPIVQKAISAMREERKSKEANVAVSSKSTVYKTYSNEDLANMSVEELRKILPHADN